MKQQELNDLIDRVNSGAATDEELGLYNHYLNQLTSGIAAGNAEVSGIGDENVPLYAAEGWNVEALGAEDVVKAELYNRIEAVRKPDKIEKVRLWPQAVPKWGRSGWKIAAAVAVMTLGVWLYYASSIGGRHSDQGQEPGSAQYSTDIAPGKNTATLTLADGKTIELSDAKTGVVIDASKLSYADGEELSIPSASGPQSGGPEASSETTPFSGSRTMSVSTPRGGQYQVVLPDGTKVWLNADSKIEFPSQFIGKTRKISLSGEGYFEVAKVYTSSLRGGENRALCGLSAANQSQRVPFIVESRGQRVEVLGTHFNINSYGDEDGVKTTLLEGAVRVSYRTGPPVQAKGLTQDLRGSSGDRSTADQQMATLKPGQQASLKGGQLHVKAIDPELAVAWKNNKFMFESQDIKDIMRMVARWYDVEVVYEGKVTSEKFGGSVSRFDNISKVLKALEATDNVHFKIEGRRIIVSQ